MISASYKSKQLINQETPAIYIFYLTGFVICYMLSYQMKLETIQTKTLRQMVYEQLRYKIITGEILPGESITHRGLASGLGVSLMPVREALWQLESEKIVVIENNKRVYVNKLSLPEMEEALKIRLELESMAAERSCELRPEGGLPTIEKLLNGMENALSNPKEFMKLNAEFHFAIYSHANSPMLLQIIDWIWSRIGAYLYIFISQGDLNLPHKFHTGMYHALVKRDKNDMKEWLRKDLEEAASFIGPFLRENGGVLERK